jgi:hypothetical protein
MATGAARKSVGRNLSLQPLWRVLGDHDTRGFTAEAPDVRKNPQRLTVVVYI